ncbi:MAG: hypothetical protein ACD_54C00275G0001 [uncultured bacterium]|nr:MAG: hypothetical protein ACD_54C00275G0001 [uncultured bacterium]
MQHHRAVFRAVFADKFRIQPVRQVEIGLEGAALPFAANRVGQFEIELRAVERAIALVDLVGQFQPLNRGFQRVFGLVPHLVRAHAHIRAGGKLDVKLLKAKVFVDRRQQRDEVGAFLLDLIFGAEDMRVILHETTHPHQPVHGTRRFVAVARAEFRQTQGQVAVGFQALIEDLHMAGAVHRLQRVDAFFLGTFFVHLDDEHILAVGFPVAGFLPQHTVNHLRRLDFLIARRLLTAAHVIFKLAIHRPAVRVPEHHAGGFVLNVEQVHLAAQLAVVALGGLFQHGHMGFQIIAVLERQTINALQHRAAGIAQPIGPGDMGQLEGIGRHLPGVLQMRATAQILPVAMPIHPQVFAFGDAVDQFHLERLAALFVIGDGAGAIPGFGFHRIAGVDDLLHLGFDLAEVFRRKRLGAVKIIEPAIVAHRADGDFHIRPDFLHSARHDVGQVVPDQFKRLRVIGHGVDRNRCIGMDRPLQIVMRTVDRG